MKKSLLLLLIIYSYTFAFSQTTGETYKKIINDTGNIDGAKYEYSTTFKYRLHNAGYGKSPSAMQMRFSNTTISDMIYQGYYASEILDDVNFPVAVELNAAVDGQVTISQGRIKTHVDFNRSGIDDGFLNSYDFPKSKKEEIISLFGENVTYEDVTPRVTTVRLSNLSIYGLSTLRRKLVDKVKEIERKEQATQAKAENEANYQQKRREADNHFYSQNYEAARMAYQEASSIKNNEQEPKNRIQEIDEILRQAKSESDPQESTSFMNSEVQSAPKETIYQQREREAKEKREKERLEKEQQMRDYEAFIRQQEEAQAARDVTNQKIAETATSAATLVVQDIQDGFITDLELTASFRLSDDLLGPVDNTTYDLGIGFDGFSILFGYGPAEKSIYDDASGGTFMVGLDLDILNLGGNDKGKCFLRLGLGGEFGFGDIEYTDESSFTGSNTFNEDAIYYGGHVSVKLFEYLVFKYGLGGYSGESDQYSFPAEEFSGGYEKFSIGLRIPFN